MLQNCFPQHKFSSVQFSRSVVPNSLRPHEPQHARPPCPSPTPGVYPNPCPLSRWGHPTISSSVVPFSSCPQSFPASGSFQMSQLFTSDGQSIEVSASTSVLPMKMLALAWSTIQLTWNDMYFHTKCIKTSSHQFRKWMETSLELQKKQGLVALEMTSKNGSVEWPLFLKNIIEMYNVVIISAV